MGYLDNHLGADGMIIAQLEQIEGLRIFVGCVESRVSNQVASYWASAPDSLFGKTSDKIAAITEAA